MVQTVFNPTFINIDVLRASTHPTLLYMRNIS